MTNDDGAAFDRAEAERHLRWLHPEGPWTLTAIPPGGGRTATETFFDHRAALGWAEGRNGREGLYVSVARLRGAVKKKASKADVESVGFLWVDVDPPKGMAAGDMAAWRDDVAGRASTHSPEPSMIASSGGGVHLYWRLDEPAAGDDPQAMAMVEAANRALAMAMGGDKACVNVDRILRLWGSQNVKPGREPTRAHVMVEGDATHPIAVFARTEAGTSASAGAAGRGETPTAAELPADLPSVDLEALPLPPSIKALIVQGDDPDEPGRYASRSEASWAVTCAMVRAGCDDATMGAVLLDPDYPIAAHCRDQSRPREYAERQIGRAREAVAKSPLDPAGRRVLDPGAPYGTARRLHGELFPTAIHTNSDWLAYSGGAYRAVEDGSMRSDVWSALEGATVRKEVKGAVEYVPFRPQPGQVSAVQDALEGFAHQPADRMAPPVWLDGEGPLPLEIVACRNGLLHVPTGELLPATSRFFTRNALTIDFDPAAPEPSQWRAFVADVLPDPRAAALLQDWFGYLLLPDTSQEKMLLMVGPPRSGKGTIQKVLTELVGMANVCAPSIKSLGGGFGLQPMIGKQVAFLSDIRIGSGSDRAAITETLLRITGRDDVTVDRKHKDAWTGRLSVRFFVASNEMPSLSDNSPALANRFVPMILEKSFLGREDHGLAERLVAELPGVLNWAVAGWRRLRERGHFELPNASTAAIAEIMELGSPVASFVRDRCDRGAGKSVEKESLYAAWQRWCEASNLLPGRPEHFARALRAATSHEVADSRPSIDGQRVNVFTGIALAGGTGSHGEGPY